MKKYFFFKFIYLFIYLFMAVLGLRFCAKAFSSCGEQGPLFIAVRRPLPLQSTGSRRAGSVVVAHGLSCSTACGIFPDQGSNPCPLHWQADSQPLRHQGSPKMLVLIRESYGYFILFYFYTTSIIIICIASIRIIYHFPYKMNKVALLEIFKISSLL